MLKTDQLHVCTPVWESVPLRNLTKKRLYLKMDCFQPTGSFKTRGISQLCQYHVDHGKTHLVSSSGGNAGYAAAYAARKLGVRCTVFVPTITWSHFVDKIKSQGADVVIEGKDFSESGQIAQEFIKEVNGGYVPPFDHPQIWAGNSTVIHEVVDQIPEKPDAVVLAVGGGGLMIGVLQAMHHYGWTDVPVYGVETHGCASFAAAVEADDVVVLDKVDTIATSLGARQISTELFAWMSKHPLYPITVSDKQAVKAMHRFLNDHRVLVEPACGAALAAIYDAPKELEDKNRILVIVCGGIGVTYERMNTFIKDYL